ncbi:MAG: hypothetical protein WCD43_13470 [Candidatus Acidiferrales bacterium]
MRNIIATLALMSIAAGYFGYARRFQLAAKIWHWRHGYTTTMGNYEVPVPEHWLITDQDSVAFTMMNTAPALHKYGKFQTAAVISIFPFRNRPIASGGLDSWLSLKRKRLEIEGVKSIEEKNFAIGGAEASCVGGSEVRDVVFPNVTNPPDTDVISLECRSADDLSVLFIGEPSDLQPFYLFAAQIRRVR